ncbi:hypothetical protein ACFXJ8_29265 [Nonomuraea sp. NPDC059194]|uniref:hypothetical protein n=1 Tax=Nonomuraea sp. NPDC059194 TaxID=3346764 RepID=UPI00367B2994
MGHRASTPRTPGDRSAARATATMSAAQPSSAGADPIATATGPATSSPIGPNISEPSASWEVTHDSDDAGRPL